MNNSGDIDTGGICTIFNTVPVADNDAESWLYSFFDEVVYMFLYPIVVSLGLAGNGAFLFMVARLARMKTAVNFLLVNLAITDIIFLTTQGAFLLVLFYSSPMPYNYPFKTTSSCIIIYGIGYLSHYCSTSIITLISVERYYAICKPLKHRRMQSKGHILRAITAVFVISTILAVVTLLKRMKLFKFCVGYPDEDRYKDTDPVYRYCGPLLGKQAIVVSTEIMYWVLFFIAAVINCYFYARIIMVLSSRKALAVNDAAENQNITVRNQVARALVINGILFFVTQIPMRLNDINEILDALGEPQILSQSQKTSFLSLAGLFLFINSALNPYVYAFSSSNYRKGFIDAFSCSSLATKSARDKASTTISIVTSPT